MNNLSKLKWHQIAGGISVILFVILFALRLDVFDVKQKIETHSKDQSTTGVFKGLHDKERWMNIFQDGRKIGYVHRHFLKKEKGYRLQENVYMQINTMGVVQGIVLRTEGNLNQDMTISSFNFDLRSSLFQFKARGTVEGKILTLYTIIPGSEKKTVIKLKEKPILANSILEFVGIEKLEIGQSKVLHIFDPASMGQRSIRISILGNEMINIMGRPQNTRKIAIDFLGAKQYAWIGDDGDILKEQGILGITIEKVTKNQAMEEFSVFSSTDLTEIASIPSNTIIEDPSALTFLKILFTNIDKESLHLHGDRQNLKNNTLLIHKETIPTRDPRPENIQALGKFLKPGPFIQSDDPKIQNKVQEIVSPEDTLVAKAAKLVAWVHKNIEKRPVLSIPNAVETITNMTGDCNEHAVLLAAMARAAGIPAQVEVGIVYQRGRFYYHAWNVLYLGKWVTADAVMGQMPADVTHVRFIRGEVDQQLDLLGVIGKLKLKIIEKSR